MWDETDGKLAPNETAHGNKVSGSSSGQRICFFLAVCKECSLNTKKTEHFDFHSDKFLGKVRLLAGVVWLVWTVFAWPFGGIFSMWLLTVESQLIHFGQMCWRARRLQIFIKIGYQSSTDQMFRFQLWRKDGIHFSRTEWLKRVDCCDHSALTNVLSG